MIYEIIDHPEIKPEIMPEFIDNTIDTQIVDKLAAIDLTKDVVICFNPINHDGKINRIVSYDIDQFVINSHESYRAIAANTVLTYQTYPRIKISLPNGLFPDFSSIIKGTIIRNVSFNKIQGIELNEKLEVKDDNVNFIEINAERGRYSFYDKIEIGFSIYDQQLFASNKFTSNHIPINYAMCNLRLLPHFIGANYNLNNIYIICSKYIYSRLPNF